MGRAQREFKGKRISNVYVLLHSADNSFKTDRDATMGDQYQLLKGIRKFCRIIYEYDQELQNKIHVYSFRDENDVSKKDIKQMIELAFKTCYLCCNKITNDEIEIIALCK